MNTGAFIQSRKIKYISLSTATLFLFHIYLDFNRYQCFSFISQQQKEKGNRVILISRFNDAAFYFFIWINKQFLTTLIENVSPRHSILYKLQKLEIIKSMVLLFIVSSICNSDYNEENKSNEEEEKNMDNTSKHRWFSILI